MEKKKWETKRLSFIWLARWEFQVLLIFIPPFFKEGGLVGNGIMLAVTFLSFAFACMVRKG